MPSLYAQVMGDAFDDLDETVRRFHSLRGPFIMRGHCQIEGPASFLGRMLAFVARTPVKPVDTDFTFELVADEHHERWTRNFPGRRMLSTMRVDNGMLVEKLGPSTFHFRLHARDGALTMELASFRILGVPCPRLLRPRIHARETGHDGLFHFDVAASLPLLGRITAYIGHLELPAVEHAR